jgi:hypothetical protein
MYPLQNQKRIPVQGVLLCHSLLEELYHTSCISDSCLPIHIELPAVCGLISLPIQSKCANNSKISKFAFSYFSFSFNAFFLQNGLKHTKKIKWYSNAVYIYIYTCINDLIVKQLINT